MIDQNPEIIHNVIKPNLEIRKGQIREQINYSEDSQVKFIDHKLSETDPILKQNNLKDSTDKNIKQTMDGLYHALDAQEIQYFDHNGQPLLISDPKELMSAIVGIEQEILAHYQRSQDKEIVTAILQESRFSKNRISSIQVAIQLLELLLKDKELTDIVNSLPLVKNFQFLKNPELKRMIVIAYEEAAIDTLKFLAQKYPITETKPLEPPPQP